MKLDRIISIATLGTSVVALLLVLKKPQPVAPVMPPAAVAANAQSFSEKLEKFEQAQPQGQSGAEMRLSGQEVTAAIAQAAGILPQAAGSMERGSEALPLTPASSANAKPSGAPNDGAGGLLSGDIGQGEPNVKDYQVNFEGDQVVGQFLTQVAGKDVWVTVKGHLGSKDGYATFDPTEFKVGDLNVPVSLVNDQLQKKLLEQRDRLKLPDSVRDLKVENSEVVVSK
jgi:hypothetical protein